MGFFERLGKLLFPPRCPFCRRVTEDGREACQSCLERLPRSRVEVKGEFFSQCLAPLVYTGDVRRAVLAMKFRGKPGNSRVLAAILAGEAAERLAGEFQVVTWVPLSARSRRKRGYDQSELIAREAAKLLGVPAEELLIKHRHTKTQSGIKGRAQRTANVSGAYRAKESCAGKRVLLIDDVVTTGATLSECSRELLMAGAERVVCAAAAGPARR